MVAEILRFKVCKVCTKRTDKPRFIDIGNLLRNLLSDDPRMITLLKFALNSILQEYLHALRAMNSFIPDSGEKIERRNFYTTNKMRPSF